MRRIQQRMILAAFVTATAVTIGHDIAFAQSAVTSTRHRTIHLTSQKIALPFGDKSFAGTGEISKIANEHCLLCHSRGMIDIQPPLTLEAWKKEIDKMRTAYGCPLREDQTAGVAVFIAHTATAHAAGGD